MKAGRGLLLAAALMGILRPNHASNLPPRVPSLLAALANGLEADEAVEKTIRERAEAAKECASRGDVLGWGKAVMPSKFPLPFCQELHQYLVDTRGEEFAATEAPRVHAKTSIQCNLIPLYQALEEPDTFDYYLNVQATEPKALAVNIAIRHELENNLVLRHLYGDQRSKSKWTDSLFVTAGGIVFQAIGAGQSIRGTNYLNKRPKYINVDDLFDEEDINNPETTQKKVDWFWSSLYPAKAEAARTSTHLTGTAINEVDLIKSLEGREGVKHRSFSAVNFETGYVLWPELKTLEKWRTLYNSGMPVLIFEREYQNKRSDSAVSKVKAAWLANWEYDPADLRFDRFFYITDIRLTCDPSIGAKLENDPTACGVIIQTARADAPGIHEYWIEEAVERRMSLDERITELTRMINSRTGGRGERRIRGARIEANGGFGDFGAQCKKRLAVPVTEVKQSKDKLTVLENKSDHFQNGRVHISRAIPPDIRTKIKNQITTNHPANDDLRDMVLLALDDQSGLWGFVS